MRAGLITCVLLFLSINVRADGYIAIRELIANPSIYAGNNISISGELTIEMEGSTVCSGLSNDPTIRPDCIELEMGFGELKNAYGSLEGKWVHVSGQFQEQDLDYEPIRREGNQLTIQLGPYFHMLRNVTQIEG